MVGQARHEGAQPGLVVDGAEPAARLHHHEGGRAEPWAVSDAPAAFIEATLGAIVGIEIPLSSLVGKWKVSQNRSAADRAGVAAGLLRERDDSVLAAEVNAPGGSA